MRLAIPSGQSWQSMLFSQGVRVSRPRPVLISGTVTYWPCRYSQPQEIYAILAFSLPIAATWLQAFV